MLINYSQISDTPILSLHTGGRIATVENFVVDPKDLKVVAFEVGGPLVGGEHGDILESKDVREYANMGMIIDSIDELVFREDVIRLNEIMQLNFNPIGMPVLTKKGTKLGKIISFTMDSLDFRIMQLIIRRPIMKAFIDPELTIGRSQIVLVDDHKIVVRDEEEKIRKEATKKDFVPNFVNPFREPQFSPAQNQNPDEPSTE